MKHTRKPSTLIAIVVLAALALAAFIYVAKIKDKVTINFSVGQFLQFGLTAADKETGTDAAENDAPPLSPGSNLPRRVGRLKGGAALQKSQLAHPATLARPPHR